jgi:hypothetical protein
MNWKDDQEMEFRRIDQRRKRMYRCLRPVLISMLFCFSSFAQTPDPSNLAHTYSIVARDSVTGELGVAVQTHAFGVGRRVPWAEAGVGAVATQSFTNPSFGPRGLQLLKEGKTAEEALQILIDSDEGRDVRQVGIVDSKGNSAGWTGKRCIKDAGHTCGATIIDVIIGNVFPRTRCWQQNVVALEEGIPRQGIPDTYKKANRLEFVIVW